MQSATLQQQPSKARKSDPKGSVGLYGRLFAPAATRPASIIEVIVGMILVFGVCYLIRPGDPLLLGINFPWIWLAATVFALRYGALLGVLAGLCVALAWLVFYGDAGAAAFPAMFFVGGLTQLVITGHFCDVWANRANRLQSVNNYLNDRLVSITNNHYLLRVSRERLERDLLSKPSTLRDAVGYLRSLSASNVQSDPLPNAQSMLEFAALSCQIGVASIFPVTRNGLAQQAIASVGERFELNADDPLLRECVEKRALAHLRHIDAQESAYLACVPIIAASDQMTGVLVVRRMPFLSLNFDNLQLLLVLLNYYADGIEQQAVVTQVQKVVAECPYDFALELGRLAHMRQVSGVHSSLVALVFPRGTIGDSLFDQVVRQRRTLDLLWAFSTEQTQVVVVLMPLTDENGIDGYLLRIESNLKTQFDTDLAQAHVAVHSAAVDDAAPGVGLEKLLVRCGHHA